MFSNQFQNQCLPWKYLPWHMISMTVLCLVSPPFIFLSFSCPWSHYSLFFVISMFYISSGISALPPSLKYDCNCQSTLKQTHFHNFSNCLKTLPPTYPLSNLPDLNNSNGYTTKATTPTHISQTISKTKACHWHMVAVLCLFSPPSPSSPSPFLDNLTICLCCI